MDEREREILRRLDERIGIDRWASATGSNALAEIRAELELTRLSYEHQLHVTRQVITQNRTAFQQVG